MMHRRAGIHNDTQYHLTVMHNSFAWFSNTLNGEEEWI